MTDELTKVHIDLPNHWATGGESIWALHLGDLRYRLENVPFYAYNLNFQDVVEAESLAPDLKPSVRRVIERSGHQTLRVIFKTAIGTEQQLALLESLSDLHVTHERCNQYYVALDLEPRSVAGTVRDRLDRWEAEGLLEYETCEAKVEDGFDALPSDDDAKA